LETSELVEQSFFVKVWREESLNDGAATWRGQITNVLRGDRRSLADLTDVADFIVPCLEEMGVGLRRGWRFRSWLCHHLM
jgi:hypothetical protein